jgi:uncharacterized membrane protein
MKDNSILDLELIISSILRIGVYLSAAVIFVGLVVIFMTGQTGYPLGIFPTSVGSVFTGLIAFKAAAIISFGLFLLIATPIFRVASSLVVFLIEKDYLYTIITLIVLTILLSSLFLGKAL